MTLAQHYKHFSRLHTAVLLAALTVGTLTLSACMLITVPYKVTKGAVKTAYV
ncbi:MAG: hypothetical protein GY868_07605, partial [Deltaproteobacteria bacterium]|nr:hypothetical protein [Deltaproteobacteria bacterium]